MLICLEKKNRQAWPIQPFGCACGIFSGNSALAGLQRTLGREKCIASAAVFGATPLCVCWTALPTSWLHQGFRVGTLSTSSFKREAQKDTTIAWRGLICPVGGCVRVCGLISFGHEANLCWFQDYCSLFFLFFLFWGGVQN